MNRTQVHIFDYFTLKLREPNIKICKYSEEKNIMKNNYKKITLASLYFNRGQFSFVQIFASIIYWF